jgi:hypothetical protein
MMEQKRAEEKRSERKGRRSDWRKLRKHKLTDV